MERSRYRATAIIDGENLGVGRMVERPIPDEVSKDPRATEILRVWIANRQMYVSMQIGMYKESGKVDEERAWGVLLADLVRHIANGLESGYGVNREEAQAKVRRALDTELDKPTSTVRGGVTVTRSSE